MKLKIGFPGKLLPFGKVPTIQEMPAGNSVNVDFDGLKHARPGIYISLFYILLIVLLLVIYPYISKAQQAAHDGLTIGDNVPDVTINNMIGYKSSSAKLSDFKGKLLIIDFWATWCSPCIHMIPKMDSLQKELGPDLQFLSVTDQPGKTVVPFLERLTKQHPFNLKEAYGDTVLNKLFPHSSLPHYVWIDKKGVVMAITGYEAINSSKIKKALHGEKMDVGLKSDILVDYNSIKPLFNISNPSDNQRINSYSILTAYKPGLGCGYYNDLFNKNITTGYHRITALNLTIAQLYQIAMSKSARALDWNQTYLAVKDTTMLNTSLSGQAFVDWLDNKKGFCYELVVANRDTGEALAKMRMDLEFYFPQYKAIVKQQQKSCLALVRTKSTTIPVSSTGKSSIAFDVTGGTMINCNLNVFLSRFRVFQQESGLILKNETGYTAQVDMDIEADMRDIDQVNEQLDKYGLKLIRKLEKADVLTISDSVPQIAKINK